jgi:probable rRNA maturation factor
MRTEGTAIANNSVKVRLVRRDQGIPAGWYRRVLRDILLRSGLSGVEVSLLITGDAGIRCLNRVYRGQDRSTNCLSFPQGGPGRSRRAVTPRLLGDIVVSVSTARREARGLGITVRTRIVFLLAHSLAHLMGYDHSTERETRTMARVEARLMKGVGG